MWNYWRKLFIIALVLSSSFTYLLLTYILNFDHRVYLELKGLGDTSIAPSTLPTYKVIWLGLSGAIYMYLALYLRSINILIDKKLK